MSGFSFGTPPAATGQTSTGFSFGAPKTAAPTAAAPAFGTQAAASGFGAAATPTFGAATATPTFGAATVAPTFGAAAAGVAAPAFGAQTAAPTFGAQAATPGFGGAATPAFGAAPTATPGFGAAPTAAPGFGAAPGAAPAFGLAPTATPAFGLGSAASGAAAAPTFSFGTATAAQSAAPTAAAPTLSFGGLSGTAIGAATTTAAPTLGLGGGNFSFGKPAATTTSASLNFGTTTTSTTSFSLGSGGLFGKPATSTAPATAPTPFVGLGGVDVSSTQPKAGDSKQDVKVKETQVPDEIAKTVDALKTYIKTQKTMASDIGRTSTSKLSNVSGGILNLQWSLQEISNAVEANYNQIKLLRKETTKTIQSVEMAQRTQDTPAGLQFENTTPFTFFQNLVAKYEQDLINFREQISLTERHMRSLTNPQNVTPDDLKRGFKQINESFISLAGRLHEIHQKVEAQKEQYLNLRKYRLRDNTNVFAKLDNPVAVVDSSRITSGPTPFSNISAISNFSKTFANSATSGAGGSSNVPTGK